MREPALWAWEPLTSCTGGGLPQSRPPSLEAPPPPQIAGQLADAVAHGIKVDATLRLGLGSAAALLAWRGTLDLLGLGHLGPSHRGVGDVVTSEDRKATFSSKIASVPGSSIGQVAYDGRTRLRDTRSLAIIVSELPNQPQ